MIFIQLINVEMPTAVGISTFISRINKTSENEKKEKYIFFTIILLMSN